MKSFREKIWGGGRKDPDEGKGRYGVDYFGVPTYSSSATIPGSRFPSRSSRNAPPPGDT